MPVMVPLRATQALWETTRDAPFPPVVATNIRREKAEYYLELPRQQASTARHKSLPGLQLQGDRQIPGYVQESGIWRSPLSITIWEGNCALRY
jgi:hypothetical protein